MSESLIGMPTQARIVPRERWQPAGVSELEPDAWAVLRAETHHLVVAGPGAGKTELLAQRASYLLQTDLARNPRRILAISYRNNAATELRDRVRERCGPELTARFDSYTFDAFAKGLVERFRHALPEGLRPPLAFDLAMDGDQQRTVVNQARAAIRALRTTTPASHFPRAHKGVEYDKEFIAEILRGTALRAPRSVPREDHLSDALVWATAPTWATIVAASPCVLTFDMLKRMAQLLVASNPRIAAALRLTYSHVFLDEFQDVTALQYELLQTCFPPAEVTPCQTSRTAILTAVGDDKQRIMSWAGALQDIFTRFASYYDASRRTLLMNYRSDRELVRIQRTLIAAIDGSCPPPVAAPANSAGTGRCEILSFDSDEVEAEFLASFIADLCSGENAPFDAVQPHDICILARMLPDRYTTQVQQALFARGIASRVEDSYNELLRDDVVRALLRVLRLTAGVGGHEAYTKTVDLLLLLADVDPGSPRARTIEEELGRKLGALQAECAQAPATRKAVVAVVRHVLEVFGGSVILRAAFPHMRNNTTYQRIMREFVDLLWLSAERTYGWNTLVADFLGDQSVPIMTVHRSKGLQYHTVAFVGLENEAWTRFNELSEEDKCLFFVAFSRAKQQVVFTYSAHRRLESHGVAVPQGRDRVSALYDLLQEAGVQVRHIT
jgi:DNA helicase II / ATP-dependent DNA helicase PcrA